MYAHFDHCHKFLKLLKKEIEDNSTLSIPGKFTSETGFTPFFPILIVVNLVQACAGLHSANDYLYDFGTIENRWVLKCNGGLFYRGYER